ncbi:HAD-IA family hydrolase [Ligilactobacillus pobuzihii]|uniref:Haloacid dehalogenase-like hydrolase n=1 Tax=Ligilactobacillus pobuzihii TaxID=449659 RepID=A0A0R2LQX2_9LACO|nr:HAD-IA family hydrolase [Ligilactobacillus pobuzihii]KRK11385.1 haloacid dehalogenase-like hydrolase [Ligilactobacillus pobuzihii E100301 = KCTC 13174]KRO02700.1 haloacid dehalogenase-like hydrolase [Ligilactobacillus pobuzihii]GEN47348.1 phosphoglycolate phosphatase [Ligilactobacillus pobuzihii]
MKYHNFFWDFDGTLYDTYQIMPKAYCQAWSIADYQITLSEAYRLMRLASLGQAFKYHQRKFNISPQKLAKIREDYRVQEQKYFGQVQAFNGLSELFEKIVAHGGKNFLLTHRKQGALELLQRDGLDKFIAGKVTGKDTFARKPAPDSLNYLIEKNSVLHSSALMVGDRSLDVEAAHNAGIAGALLDPDDLMAEQHIEAEIQLSSLAELLDHVK